MVEELPREASRILQPVAERQAHAAPRADALHDVRVGAGCLEAARRGMAQMVGECVQAAPRALSVGELLRERFSGALHMRAMPVVGRPRSALREESLLERQHGEGFRREVAGQEVHARHRPFRRRQMGPAAYALVRWRAGRIAFRPLRAFLQRGGGACETVQPGSESHRLRLRELHRSAAQDARRGGHGNHLRAAQLLPL